MRVFLSHNKSDKQLARLLGMALVEQGVGVWFDEWNIKLGDSITRGISTGLEEADTFLILWSKNAERSGWMPLEFSSFLHRRAQDQELKIVPIMLDDTPLPPFVRDFKGAQLRQATDIPEVAAGIGGKIPARELARRLQGSLIEITGGGSPAVDPYIVCPKCGAEKLTRGRSDDFERGDTYEWVRCSECDWLESGEV